MKIMLGVLVMVFGLMLFGDIQEGNVIQAIGSATMTLVFTITLALQYVWEKLEEIKGG
jgi:hypothetical protein